ncbi:aminotransferase class I/II-fold pyridoxal phosphate-dependent enzyme [Mitsuaria sp. GD03876]|uniref:pyridoxal phosphate-dependent aminotransferase n=1 Tax=Mitsuaria sp. GD03876 TaxID=2975399 RepID=UPI00244BF6E7|nr:aminotransferase class I/II-fold pyridoxal phosphate-dependent enzyme [Mitsuaria sp. GD03876]MDH0863535.1 aminotransferase class I/II-fold pyridoxal phosphate-dependent enzyme [Mitsuaria sp. GD03876]
MNRFPHLLPLTHGGTDAGLPVRHDFSTNAHPLGPPPAALDAVLRADRLRYPDPAYTALRARLGAWHGVEADRVLPASGGSEAIRRLTLAAMLSGVTRVCVPRPGFGDYAAAAHALGLQVTGYEDAFQLADALTLPSLVWVCDPNNPTGGSFDQAEWTAVALALGQSGSQLVVDQAYGAMRLAGGCALPRPIADGAWRLVCPNKAFGLTGVRGAYLIGPRDGLWIDRVAELAPSWVLAAEGQALLEAWTTPSIRDELDASLPLLREWRGRQWDRMAAMGFDQIDGGVANFWLAALPAPWQSTPEPLLEGLRALGIKLRDATSFGLPGLVRVSVQAPDAVDALEAAMRTFGGRAPMPPLPSAHGAFDTTHALGDTR